MEPKLIDREFYPSFGECIYCGAKAGSVELTNEHIVPFSLGGNAWIKDGSCRACAAETSKLERELGRKILSSMRDHIGEQTRRPNRRPATGTFLAVINGGEPQEFTVPLATAPVFTYLPVWGMPTILTGEPLSDGFPRAKAQMFYWLPENIADIVGANPTDDVKILNPPIVLTPALFARALAKVAYCQAILFWGLHQFDKLNVVDLILGRYPYVSHYVGSPIAYPEKPLPNTVKHGIKLSTISHERRDFHIAEVRLYGNAGTAEYGMPVYTVVVGASNNAEPMATLLQAT